MDYKKMWENLKKEIVEDLEYHKRGDMQSISESIQGEIKCNQFLDKMRKIEKRQQNNRFINTKYNT